MRRELIAIAFAGSLSASCITTGTGGITPASVQAAVLAACAYAVPAQEIASLLATGNPALTTAEAVAALICQTAAGTVTPAPGPGPAPAIVLAKSARRGSATVRLYGVTLHLKHA